MSDVSNTDTRTRYTVHFEGRVQGVGFRFTTADIARHHAVAGYVQNLPDGRVRLVAEGESQAVQNFVDDVRKQMRRYIHHDSVETADATGEFGQPGAADAFGIRH
jgi:acylphosphatase